MRPYAAGAAKVRGYRLHRLRQQIWHAVAGLADLDVDLKDPPDRIRRDGVAAVAVDGELAPVQQHDPVGEPHGEVEVVQDRDHGGAASRAQPCGFDQVDLVPQVEAGGRLVQQQQARAVQRLAAGELHQHAGKMRALLLAARQRRQLPVAEIFQSDFVQRRLDQRLRRGAAAFAGTHLHDLLDREREGDVDMLRQHRAMQRELARRIG